MAVQHAYPAIVPCGAVCGAYAVAPLRRVHVSHRNGDRLREPTAHGRSTYRYIFWSPAGVHPTARTCIFAHR